MSVPPLEWGYQLLDLMDLQEIDLQVKVFLKRGKCVWLEIEGAHLNVVHLRGLPHATEDSSGRWIFDYSSHNEIWRRRKLNNQKPRTRTPSPCPTSSFSVVGQTPTTSVLAWHEYTPSISNEMHAKGQMINFIWNEMHAKGHMIKATNKWVRPIQYLKRNCGNAPAQDK